MLLHFEGAEPLDPDGHALDVFYAAGVRSVGLTHSRRNRYCQGVPFKFPSSPDLGPGLNDAGKALVRQLNARRVMIDLSHLNERGFWDVAKLSDAPLVATHSNAHALCPHPRNLTDRQLNAIRDSRGVAGLNFHVGFLRADGAHDQQTPIATMVDHVEYMVGGSASITSALGSDFDGATTPATLGDAAGLPALIAALEARGYHGEDAEARARQLVRVLRRPGARSRRRPGGQALELLPIVLPELRHLRGDHRSAVRLAAVVREVLLVVVLGFVERRERRDLGHDGFRHSFAAVTP